MMKSEPTKSEKERGDVRKCCGWHGSCPNTAKYPEENPQLCFPCYLIDVTS